MENWAGPNLSPGLKGRTRGSDGVIAWNDFFFHLKEHVAKRRSWGIHITAKPTWPFLPMAFTFWTGYYLEIESSRWISNSPNCRPSIVWTRPAHPLPVCPPQAHSTWVRQNVLGSLAHCVLCYFPIWEAPPQVIFLPIKASLFFSHNIKGPLLHVVFPTTFAETTAFLTAHHSRFLHHISVKSSQVCGLSPCLVFFTYICIFLPLSPLSVKFNKHVVGAE